MINVFDKIRLFAVDSLFQGISSIEPIPMSGGDRRYFRLYTENGQPYVACYNENIPENETFLYYTEHFRAAGAPVPEVLVVSSCRSMYLMEDLGKMSLLNVLEAEGYTDRTFSLFQKSLEKLAELQIGGHVGLDYQKALTAKEFGKQAILSDLLYFKYYFVDTLKIPYDKQGLLDDLDILAAYLTRTEYKFFMFRDFQSRNIIERDNEVYFIDYQGGMLGALQYDVASLLWQAKADLSDEWKSKLLERYIDKLESLLLGGLDRSLFINQYFGYVLIRLLQVLGAYGFRGLFERKTHFLTSIPLALRNLRWFLDNRKTGLSMPTLDLLLYKITSEEVIARFEHIKAKPEDPLVVTVKSFSYKKSGVPKDNSGNGGGFVFDCRGVLNPGRYEAYKTLTGRDKEVMDFLEQKTSMPDFLSNVYNIIDISVEDYLVRGFSNLLIGFGCTGGQHRSVYAAEQLARHLHNKYKLKVVLEHVEQGIKETKSSIETKNVQI